MFPPRLPYITAHIDAPIAVEVLTDPAYKLIHSKLLSYEAVSLAA